MKLRYKDTLFAKYRKNNEPRQMIYLLVRKYCRGRYSLNELAGKLQVSVHTLGANAYKLKKKISGDNKLKTRYSELKDILENVKAEN